MIHGVREHWSRKGRTVETWKDSEMGSVRVKAIIEVRPHEVFLCLDGA